MLWNTYAFRAYLLKHPGDESPMDSQQPYTSPEFATAQVPISDDPPPDPPASSVLRRTFFGQFGLRAGWGLLIYCLLIFAIQRFVNVIGHHIVASHQHAAAAAGNPVPPAPKPDPSQPQNVAPLLAVEAVVAGVVLLLACLMSFIERRRFGVYGLGGQHSIKFFITGAFWGLLALSLLVLSLKSLHLLVFDARVDHGLSIFGWGFTLLLGFLLVGIFEENFFRGYLQFTLTRGFVGLGNLTSAKHSRAIAFWIAAVLTSALFLVAHTSNAGETKIGLISVFLAGLVFVVAMWRTGSLWWAIGFHMAWDWAQSFLYGVPDSGGLIQGRLFATHPLGNPTLSGGTVGPEGSVLIIPVLILVIIVLLLTKRSPQPPLEQLLRH